MNHLLEQADLAEQVACDSAGTSSYHIGEPPDRRMTDAARQRGLEMRGCARQFNQADFAAFDLILAMDRENYANICALDPAGTYRDKVHLMCDFCTHRTLKDVPDPYYGGPNGFNQVLDILADGCQGLLKYVIQQLSVKQ